MYCLLGMNRQYLKTIQNINLVLRSKSKAIKIEHFINDEIIFKFLWWWQIFYTFVLQTFIKKYLTLRTFVF